MDIYGFLLQKESSIKLFTSVHRENPALKTADFLEMHWLEEDVLHLIERNHLHGFKRLVPIRVSSSDWGSIVINYVFQCEILPLITPLV